MDFLLTSKDYMDYIKLAYEKIHADGDYITALDAATGDGDHWYNIDMGFEKLVEAYDEISNMNIFDAFKKISMTMMSVIGGSGGVLYGSAYMEAAKNLKDKEGIDKESLYIVFDAMQNGIMKRGGAEPGFKTMLDTLYAVTVKYKEGLDQNKDTKQLLLDIKQAAVDGANSTKDMEAIRGRAYYQANKGVGHLDPGAVTMCYQIESLADFILDNKLA